jgi:integrase/recombinase XerD
MEPSYSHSWSLQCVLEGPLASHISSFTKSLEDQGFSQESSHVQTRLVADFSRWLNQANTCCFTRNHGPAYIALSELSGSSSTSQVKRYLRIEAVAGFSAPPGRY